MISFQTVTNNRTYIFWLYFCDKYWFYFSQKKSHFHSIETIYYKHAITDSVKFPLCNNCPPGLHDTEYKFISFEPKLKYCCFFLPKKQPITQAYNHLKTSNIRTLKRRGWREADKILRSNNTVFVRNEFNKRQTA